MSDDLPESPFGEVRRVDMQPGDLFVLNVPRLPSDEEAEWLRALWQAAAGDARLLILGPGMELTVYRPVGPEALPAEKPRADLRWHYGPTDWDPDPAKRWHGGCPNGPSEVLVFEGGASCCGCGADDAPREGV